MPSPVGESPRELGPPSHGLFGKGRRDSRLSIDRLAAAKAAHAERRGISVEASGPLALGQTHCGRPVQAIESKESSSALQGSDDILNPADPEERHVVRTRPGKDPLSAWPTDGAVFRTTAPCVWSTALGSDVVPDVKTAVRRSAGRTSASTASSNRSSAAGSSASVEASDKTDPSAHARDVPTAA